MSLSILAVDDEPATLKMLRLLLKIKRPDWTLLTAENGPQALDLAANQSVDCVLLDISMPDMDGLEVCERMRQLPNMQRAPIVIFTALDTPDRRDRAAAAGATAFWIKTFQATEFVPQIEQLVAQAKQ
jgi:two-component system, cell cycle response regulator